MIESVVSYGCEVWLLKREEQRALLALRMGYLRFLRLQKISNTIKNRTQAEQTILDRIQRSFTKLLILN